MAHNNDGKKPSDLASDEELREFLKEQEDKIHKAMLAQRQSTKKGKGIKSGAKKAASKPGSGKPKTPKKSTGTSSPTKIEAKKEISTTSSKEKLNQKENTLKQFVSAAVPKKK